MKKTIYLLSLILLVACGTEQGESSELKEAKAVHESIIKLQGDIDEKIHEKLEQVDMGLEKAIAMSDSVSALKMEQAQNALHDMHGALDEWRETLLEIPGHEHSHDHGDHGHEHKHDAVKEKLLEGLTDAEILEIQNELKQNLDAISKKIDSILQE